MTDDSTFDDTKQRTETDEDTHVFDMDTESVSVELISAIAAVESTDPTELALLSDCVDMDALDAFLSTSTTGRRCHTDRRVTFEYEGYHVQLSDDGTITLDPR